MYRTDLVKKRILVVPSLMITLFHLIPFYILFTTSLKPKGDFSSKWILSRNISFQNFGEAWDKANLGNALVNTSVITVCAAILLIFFGSLAAYPLARRNTRLNRLIYTLFIAIMVVPPLTVLVPLYQLVVNIGMMNTLEIAILNNVAAYMPLTIFLYSAFIRSTIPKEIEEVARVDGATTLSIFYRIVFPLLKPVTATILIISCIFIWNDYQFAIFFLQAEEVKTFTVALSGFFGENVNNLNLVAAAAIISMMPMVILFLFLQKYFIKGLTSGSVKG